MNDSLSDKKLSAAKRGMGRDSLLLKAILRFPNTGEERKVRIRNLSAGGLMAEIPIDVSLGDLVEVNLHNMGWLSGHVAWVTDGRIGIAFNHPINPKDARKPVGMSELDIPDYLKKLNRTINPAKIRRV